MPIAITEAPYRPVPTEAQRKVWTRPECEAIEASGVLGAQHLELIEGEVINRMGKKRPHANAQRLVMIWLAAVFTDDFVDSEAPIDVAPSDNAINEPVPDIIVLNRPFWQFQAANPGPCDLRLVVEISDSTLGFDLTTKAALYAAAGIPEYWVLDIAARRLLVHRRPDPSRRAYSAVDAYAESESVTPLAAPQAAFPVSTAFRS